MFVLLIIMISAVAMLAAHDYSARNNVKEKFSEQEACDQLDNLQVTSGEAVVVGCN